MKQIIVAMVLFRQTLLVDVWDCLSKVCKVFWYIMLTEIIPSKHRKIWEQQMEQIEELKLEIEKLENEK